MSDEVRELREKNAGMKLMLAMLHEHIAELTRTNGQMREKLHEVVAVNVRLKYDVDMLAGWADDAAE